MKSPNPKPEYSSEEVGTIYSYILSAYLDKSWNVFYTNASLNEDLFGFGILELPGRKAHQFKLNASLLCLL